MTTNDALIESYKTNYVLIAVGSACIVITIYHCITACWCNASRSSSNTEEQSQPVGSQMTDIPLGIRNPVNEFIPAHKYEKGVDIDQDGEENRTCAVCLCEFEEGDDLRTLPECKHSFHVACIDMWLHSHSNCPMCRAETSPLPFMCRDEPCFRSGEFPRPTQNPGTLEAVVVQS